MIEKLKSYSTHPYLQNFRDTRFLGFVIFGVLTLLATWSGINVIDTNYQLQKEIAQLDQQNQVDKLANSNLKLKNEYYNTDTYLELQARKAFGKGAPGETLLLVPKEVAYKYAPELPQQKSEASQTTKADKKPMYKKNFEQWLDFLLHRQD